MLFVLVSFFLSLVAAACNLEGQSYMMDDNTITFGASVPAGWFTALTHDAAGMVTFSTWTPVAGVTNSFTVKEHYSSFDELPCGASQPDATYQVTWSATCDKIIISSSDDFLCESRPAFFNGSFTEVVPDNCGTVGGSVTSGASDIVFGPDGWMVITLGEDVAYLDRADTVGLDWQTHGVFSYPGGDPICPTETIGSYAVQWEAITCGLQFCGISDDCSARAMALHNSKWNSFAGNDCPAWGPSVPTPPPMGECSSGRSQWNAHPYDCIDQAVDGGCAFCGGRVSGRDINLCVKRNGAKCNDLFNQVGTHAYCNLAFECGPASGLAMSLALFVLCVIVALF